MGNLPKNFTRDTSLAADVADQFGGGAGNAEQLTEANALRYGEELVAAQLLPGESGLPDDRKRRPGVSFERSVVAKAADLDADTIHSWDIHGDYVVYSFETSDGRVHKDVLVINSDDKLEAAATKDSPTRAAIRASVEATAQVTEAQSEAAEIVRKAREKADKIQAEAAAKAEEDRVEAVQKAQEDEAAPKKRTKAESKSE